MSIKQLGNRGEELAESVLRGLGIEMIQKIGTPVKLTQFIDFSGKRHPGVYRVSFGERVAGDRRGVLSDGTSVLIEVKTYTDVDRLQYSFLKAHQHEDLLRHSKIGSALSLLVWVHNTGVYVMKYPIHGFAPRKSINLEMAEAIHIETCKRINEITRWGSMS